VRGDSRNRPVALITGASAGLGATFARKLAAQGYDLLLVARRRERLEALAEDLRREHGVEAEPVEADLTDEAGLARIESVIAASERLELLVNNAGFGVGGLFFRTPLEGSVRMHQLHVMAALRLTHAALAGMTARGRGAVINVSSVSAFTSSPGTASYHATKAWMNAFTAALHIDLRMVDSPVRVQALCPGFTLTEFHDVMGMDRSIVPRSWWMPAEAVVEASLNGLERGQLFVVPGWRYKLIVLLLKILPRQVIEWATLRGPGHLRRGVKESGGSTPRKPGAG
jgi:uncharacterized protein